MTIDPIFQATFLRRYKRFFADFLLPDGKTITAHCANTGSMAGLLVEGSPALLSYHPHRKKLLYSWEAVKIGEHWCGLNTMNPNRFVREALELNKFPDLGISKILQMEAKISEESRCDILALDKNGNKIFIEIKNCTLEEDGLGLFPDSPTERGQKHIKELVKLSKEGHRSVLIFVSQHEGIHIVKPADDIDPVYGELLREAVFNGYLEVRALKVHFKNLNGILDFKIEEELPVDLS